LVLAFLVGPASGCSCDPCPPEVTFLAKPVEGSRVVWTVDDKPAATQEQVSEHMKGGTPSCEAYFDGKAKVEESGAGEAETQPYLLCKRKSDEDRGGIDQFELTYPFDGMPFYRGEASVRINPISWTEGQVLKLRGGDFGLELFHARDVAERNGTICEVPVKDLPITVTVERAVGGAAPEPAGVTADFERVFRVEMALEAARGEVDRSSLEIEGACPSTVSFTASLRMRIDAASVYPRQCAFEDADAGTPDAGAL
jgi:hypothetical protein